MAVSQHVDHDMINISAGRAINHFYEHKFGFNPEINDVEETIWQQGGIYVYPTSPVVMTVTSASGATDSGVQIRVEGLDQNWDRASETVTLNASGTATTTTTFIRINKTFTVGATAAAGQVTVSNNSVNYALQTALDQQTLQCVFSIPRGFACFLLQNDISVHTENTNKYGETRLMAREFGSVFRTQDKHTVGNHMGPIEYPIPKRYPPKTDIEVRAIASSANADLTCTASLDMVLIKGY